MTFPILAGPIVLAAAMFATLLLQASGARGRPAKARIRRRRGDRTDRGQQG